MTLTVNTEVDGSSHLVLDVVSARTQQYMYTIKLLHLYGIETNLNDGRFEHFSRIPQENHIEISFEDANHRQLLKQWLPNVMDWIATHSQETWSFYVSMKNVNTGDFDFSFANGVTAVAFALVWK